MPDEVTAMVVVSLLFLAVCALNLMGLLLAQVPGPGARRSACGARWAPAALDIFVQHVVECELVAVLGGAIGIAAVPGRRRRAQRLGQDRWSTARGPRPVRRARCWPGRRPVAGSPASWPASIPPGASAASRPPST